jgi:hypothetical protein
MVRYRKVRPEYDDYHGREDTRQRETLQAETRVQVEVKAEHLLLTLKTLPFHLMNFINFSLLYFLRAAQEIFHHGF